MARTELKSLTDMESFRKELRVQIENILVGKSVDKSLESAWSKCRNAMDETVKEVNSKLKEVLAPTEDSNITNSDAEKALASCERAHKLRQAIKICATSGEVYWMWKLQPGEELPDRYEYV